jgi:hypothetical protein
LHARKRSRSAGISVHHALETVSTIDRNMQLYIGKKDHANYSSRLADVR